MRKYAVRLTATATVEAHAHVEAETLKEASEKAMQIAKNGGLVWEYTGAEDDIEVEEVVREDNSLNGE